MSSPSPSEFLTFYRRGASISSQLLRSSTRTPIRSAPVSIRTFTVSAPTHDIGKDKEHVTKRNDTLDPQASNAKSGIDSAKKSGSGGHATEGKDSAKGAAKAKKENPEAPDPAIGMQDERGGRGT
ncbi:hypothetical protein P280DRAFT_216944 [Massarina eburnea CBS 473.64]|uniref:Uncharacterized protein n=1 Tax=Massarina eburnea CBS 473.64 TaxID=1395130 RepID=A0A6A6S9B7_9PLEO|nr:hypothetical protein P280DRAFT_216944 [Massarina eburnea CBS 473.64]